MISTRFTTNGVPAAPPKIDPATQTGAGATAATAAALGARRGSGACNALAAVANITALYIMLSGLCLRNQAP